MDASTELDSNVVSDAEFKDVIGPRSEVRPVELVATAVGMAAVKLDSRVEVGAADKSELELAGEIDAAAAGKADVKADAKVEVGAVTRSELELETEVDVAAAGRSELELDVDTISAVESELELGFDVNGAGKSELGLGVELVAAVDSDSNAEIKSDDDAGVDGKAVDGAAAGKPVCVDSVEGVSAATDNCESVEINGGELVVIDWRSVSEYHCFQIQCPVSYRNGCTLRTCCHLCTLRRRGRDGSSDRAQACRICRRCDTPRFLTNIIHRRLISPPQPPSNRNQQLGIILSCHSVRSSIPDEIFCSSHIISNVHNFKYYT